MRIALLGPLEVRDAAGGLVSLPGARLRALLVRLALEPGRAIGAEALIEAVWGERPPAGATTVQDAAHTALTPRSSGPPGPTQVPQS
jgi:DNA-binding SARP family transcriptional activator